MNTRLQIFLDKHIARILVVCLNVFVRILGKLLSIDHNLEKPFQRIVISKYKGMGSILQATPLLQTLKSNYPDAQITFVSSKANVHILHELHEIIDNTIILDDTSFLNLVKSLPVFIFRTIKLRADIWIDLEIYAHTSSLLTTLSMSKNRLGYYLRSSQYRMGIFTHMMFFNTYSPVSETYLQMARLLNCKDLTTKLYPLKSNVDIGKFDLGKNYFIINPNASDLRIERRWPLNNYISLIDSLRNSHPDVKLILIGSPGEAAYTSQIKKAFSEDKSVINFAGKTTISELIQIISKANVMITNDSGPMHIAFSTSTKTVALFGPCNPKQYGDHINTIALYKPVYCSPCVHEFQQAPCHGNNICMQLITVVEVIQAIKEILENKAGSILELPLIYQNQKNTLGKVTRR